MAQKLSLIIKSSFIILLQILSIFSNIGRITAEYGDFRIRHPLPDRRSGTFLHITSLPSPYGIGTLGEDAEFFILFLSESKQRIWQMLPVNALRDGISPFNIISTFAGNHFLIDLDYLIQDLLIDYEDVENEFWGDDDEKLEWEHIKDTKIKVLKKAFEKFKEQIKWTEGILQGANQELQWAHQEMDWVQGELQKRKKEAMIPFENAQKAADKAKGPLEALQKANDESIEAWKEANNAKEESYRANEKSKLAKEEQKRIMQDVINTQDWINKLKDDNKKTEQQIKNQTEENKILLKNWEKARDKRESALKEFEEIKQILENTKEKMEKSKEKLNKQNEEYEKKKKEKKLLKNTQKKEMEKMIKLLEENSSLDEENYKDALLKYHQEEEKLHKIEALATEAEVKLHQGEDLLKHYEQTSSSLDENIKKEIENYESLSLNYKKAKENSEELEKQAKNLAEKISAPQKRAEEADEKIKIAKQKALKPEEELKQAQILADEAQKKINEMEDRVRNANNRISNAENNINRIIENDPYKRFLKYNEYWLDDYCLFVAVREKLNNKSWLEWPEDIRNRHPEAMKKYSEELKETIEFHKFLQFKFERQFSSLKGYANYRGIKLMVNLPLYVQLDSADVWAHREVFQFNQEGWPSAVAGFPPDYFKRDGQLWGNPLYDWQTMEKNDYDWFMRRIGMTSWRFDIIKLDHFRGLESYWSIPYGDRTARNGWWVKGPDRKLIDKLKEIYPHVEFVAEDVGYLTNEINALIEYSGFPGIRVLQWGFDAMNPSYYLPHKYPKNSFCYTGTHDDHTILGWQKAMKEEDRTFAEDYLWLKKGEDLRIPIIRAGFATASKAFIVQMQDYLNLDDKSRMSNPGKGENNTNWTWRIKRGFEYDNLSVFVEGLSRTYERAHRYW